MELLVIAFVMLVVSFVLQSFLTPKTERPKPAGLDEWDFPQVDDGTPRGIVFGDVWREDAFAVWYGRYRTKKIKSGGSKK